MNAILAYYQAINDGTVTVGRWTRLIYEYIVRGLEARSFIYNAKKATAAIRFVEAFCHHHEGALAPQRIKLELWQKALLSLIFGITDESGNRQFREVFFVVARKNGKSTLLSGIALYCLIADQEAGAEVYSVASKKDQARIIYEEVCNMVRA